MDNPFPCKNCIVFAMCMSKLSSCNDLDTNFDQIFDIACKPLMDFLITGEPSRYFNRRNEILTQFKYPRDNTVKVT